jgi:hypothetical protein
MQEVLDLLLESTIGGNKAFRLQEVPVEERVPAIVGILEEFIALDQKTIKVHRDLELCEGTPLYWAQNNIQSVEGEGKSFTKSFTFANHHTGMTMMFSWALTTTLWSGMLRLYRYLATLTPLTTTVEGGVKGTFMTEGEEREFLLPSPDSFADFPTMAHNVYRSVDYCIQDEMGMMTVVCPLIMTLYGLGGWPGYEKDIAWGNDMLARARRKGVRIINFLK